MATDDVQEAALAYAKLVQSVAAAVGTTFEDATGIVARLAAAGYTLWTQTELDDLRHEWELEER